jgi:hypothetical protein
MHRRVFLASTVASAAASGVSGMPISGCVSQTRTLANPQLIELRTHPGDESRAVAMRSLPIAVATSTLISPVVELTPLACTQSRLANNAGIDIELRHPGCGMNSILYSANNVGLGAFPAAVASQIQPDTLGRITLIVTQRLSDLHQKHMLRIPAKRAGSYLLAIPTEPGARAPLWRASTIELNNANTPTRVRSLFGSRARSCMLMSVRVSESNAHTEGEPHAG